MKNKFLLSLISMIFCLQGLGYAQDPNAETAAAEATRFEREAELSELTLKTGFEESGTQSIEPYDDEGQVLDESISFRLNDIVIDGNELISTSELKALVQDELNREVNLNVLRKIATTIKNYYRSKGYVAAFVYVPPQEINNGLATINVVEGEIDKVEVTGNRWFSERIIKWFLRVKEGQILFVDQLESALIFLNKHKDIAAKSVLKPGEKPKTTSLEVQVEDKFPIHATVDVNNLGTQNTGRTRFGVGVTHNNLLGLSDTLAGRFQIGSGVVAVGTDYSIPVHESGTRIGARYSHSQVDLSGSLKALDIEGESDIYGIYFLQPIIRKNWVELTANTGFDWKSSETTIRGVKAAEDESRILNIGIDSEFTDRWGKTFNPHSVHIGFSSFLGASDKADPNSTRAGSGGQFWVYRTSLIRYHRLPWGMMLAIRANVQLTNDRLPPSEQIRLGGAFSVRGYSEGEYLADYGAFIANELYIPTYFFPKDWKLPYSKRPLRQQIQGVVFYDFGGGNLRGALTGEQNSRTLAGAGIGLRVHLFDRVYARAQWATPVGSDARNASDTAFYYGVTTELF